MTTRMWEAVAVPGKLDDLVAWTQQHAPADAQIYRSADDRVVVIDRTGAGLPDAPDDLLARPAHIWDFEPVVGGR
jgi:hypothetical protein